MRNLNNLLFILVALLCMPALSSCGQKGPLKLPPSPPPSSAPLSSSLPLPLPLQNTPPKFLQNITDSASTKAGQ